MRSIVLFALFFILQSALFKPEFCNSTDKKEEYHDFVYSEPSAFVMSKKFSEEKAALENNGLKLFAIPLCDTYLTAPPHTSINQPEKHYPITILVVLKNVSNKTIKIKYPQISNNHILSLNISEFGFYHFLFSNNKNRPKLIQSKPRTPHMYTSDEDFEHYKILVPGQSFSKIYDLNKIHGSSFLYYFQSMNTFKTKIVYITKNNLAFTKNKNEINLEVDSMIWTGRLESNILTFKTVFDKNSNKPVKDKK